MANKAMPHYKRTWIYLAGIGLIVFLATVIIGNFFTNTPSHYDLAQEAYIMGAYSTALEEFDKAVSQTPNEPEYLIGRGLAYLKLENYDEALADLNGAILLAPDSTDTRPYFHGGYIMLISGNYDFAIESLSITIERGDSSAQVYGYRGLAYYNLGNYAEAVIDADLAISIDSSQASYYQLLGDAQYTLGNNAEALSAYTRYVELIPEAESYIIDNINAITAQE